MDYLRDDGRTVDMREAWQFLPKSEEMRRSPAPNKLLVGGTGSGKSGDSLMHGVVDYCLRFRNCDMLAMRRTFPDLEKGLISDFRTYVPRELYKFNESKHTATFLNGSRCFFGHLANGTERDLHQYLSSSFPYVLVDECAQFSGEAWAFLKSRNRVNPGCEPDPELGYPVPEQVGCTNPLGPHWSWYKATFVEQRPYEAPEGTKKDKLGRWWVQEAGEWRLVHNPDDWFFIHSSILDNPYLLQKDPAIIGRLNALPSGMREKLLWGSMDKTVGQYFDNFSLDTHVVNLRRDPDVVRWEPWQPRWMGWDWGRAHYCTVFWFTKALVKRLDGTYKLKTLCYRELVTKGKNNVEVADEVARMSRDADGKPERISAIYFSHEKFAKQMEAHSPADELSRLLRERGLPSVSPATRDRIGRASLTYNLLDRGELAILDSCPQLIEAIPQLMRDEKNIEDVLKVDGKSDDIYDGCSYGIYGYLSTRPKPKAEREREQIEAIEDPFSQAMMRMKVSLDAQRSKRPAGEQWMSRLREPAR